MFSGIIIIIITVGLLVLVLFNKLNIIHYA